MAQSANGGAKKTPTALGQDALIAAINDAAGYCRTLWAAFITYMGAIFILVSGTTHEDLLRETPVKMPLFELGVPLRLFYVIAPILLVLFHLNLLLKLHDLRLRISALVGAERHAPDLLRRRMLAFDYGLLVGGLVSDRRERSLLKIVSYATIFVIPALLLLFTQLQFLPYHGAAITWTHRGAVSADFVIMLLIQHWMGAPIPRPAEPAWPPAVAAARRLAVRAGGWIAFAVRPNGPGARAPANGVGRRFEPAQDASRPVGYPMLRGVRRFALGLGRIVLVAAALAVSVFVLAYPSEGADIFWPLLQPEGRVPVAGSDYAERFGVSRSLYLPGRTFWAKDPPPEILAVYEAKYLSDRSATNGGRSLSVTLRREAEDRYAVPMDIRGRDLSFADFEGCSFRRARMNGDFHAAVFRDADLQGADFTGANLRGAKMAAARLQEATFTAARASDSDFESAELERAVFNYAELTGADFEGASIYGAAFETARLQGADFLSVDGRRANFEHAKLTAARFGAAHLESADFSYAALAAADFEGAMLQNALLQQAVLRDANLGGAFLLGTGFLRAEVSHAIFLNADFKGKIPDIDNVLPADVPPGAATSSDAWGPNATGLADASGDYVLADADEPFAAGSRIRSVDAAAFFGPYLADLTNAPCRGDFDRDPVARRAIAAGIVASMFGDAFARNGQTDFSADELPRYLALAAAILKASDRNCVLPALPPATVRYLRAFAAAGSAGHPPRQ